MARDRWYLAEVAEPEDDELGAAREEWRAEQEAERGRVLRFGRPLDEDEDEDRAGPDAFDREGDR